MSTETHVRTFILIAIAAAISGVTVVAACALVAATLFHAYLAYREWRMRQWIQDIAQTARESVEAGAHSTDTSSLFDDAVEEARALDARWDDMEERIHNLENNNA